MLPNKAPPNLMVETVSRFFHLQGQHCPIPCSTCRYSVGILSHALRDHRWQAAVHVVSKGEGASGGPKSVRMLSAKTKMHFEIIQAANSGSSTTKIVIWAMEIWFWCEYKMYKAATNSSTVFCNVKIKNQKMARSNIYINYIKLHDLHWLRAYVHACMYTCIYTFVFWCLRMHTHISMYLNIIYIFIYIFIYLNITKYYKHVDILKARVDFVSKGRTQKCSRSRRSSFVCRTTPCVFKFRTECVGYSFKAACWWTGQSTVSFFKGSKASIGGAQVSLPTKKRWPQSKYGGRWPVLPWAQRFRDGMDGHDWPFPLVNECVFLVKHGGIRHISIYRQTFLIFFRFCCCMFEVIHGTVSWNFGTPSQHFRQEPQQFRWQCLLSCDAPSTLEANLALRMGSDRSDLWQLSMAKFWQMRGGAWFLPLLNLSRWIRNPDHVHHSYVVLYGLLLNIGVYIYIYIHT